MNLFKKCGRDSNNIRVAKALGVYPFFKAVEESSATEVVVKGKKKIMVGSNNYLALTHHPRVQEACTTALARYGSGSTGSRLLTGTLDLHEELEEKLARFYRKPAALVFSTGYQTNLGVLAALVGRDDHVFLDRHNHACLVDGARLSFGKTHRYPHRDLKKLDRALGEIPDSAGTLIATDGVFSMEGDLADLPELTRIARAHGAALMVDDAHALGVLGENGAGTARHFGLDREVDLIAATFSKSLASIGGVVAGPKDVIQFLRHRSRPFVFTASMPPASVAGALTALEVMQEEPELRAHLWAISERLKAGLESLGYDLGPTVTPILPVRIGEMWRSGRVWKALFKEGIFTYPVIPPAVPTDQCMIRVSLTAAHTDAQVDQVLDAFARVAKVAAVS